MKPLKVRELIKELKQCNPEADVVVQMPIENEFIVGVESDTPNVVTLIREYEP